MHARWKILGLAGVAGVAATGVVIASQRRGHRDYDPDELRERLHQRLAEATPSGDASAPPTDAPAKRRRLGRRIRTPAVTDLEP